MNSSPKIARLEWIVISTLILLTLLIVSAPYLYGWISAGSSNYFLGTHTINNNDTYTYLAWIEQAKNGQFFFKDLYTSEAQSAIFFHPLFLILGFFAKILNLSSILIFHFARLALGSVFLYLSYYFISFFFERRDLRMIIFIALIFSSGLGFLIGSNSVDLWIIESITFLNLLESPINLASMSLIIVCFIQFLRLREQFSRRDFLFFSLAINVLVLIHTYDLMIVYTTLFCSFVFNSLVKKEKTLEELRLILYLFISSFPAILWTALVVNENIPLSVWANLQTNAPSFNLIYYLSGYGLLLVLAGIGIVHQVRLRKSIFLISWFLAYILLIFNPLLFRFQRKLGEGLHILIAIFAGVGLVWLCDYIVKKNLYKYIWISLVLGYLSFTNIYVIYRDFNSFKEKIFPYYLSKQEYAAIEKYQKISTTESVALTSYDLGNLLPGITGRTVYLGHHDQTVNFYLKYDILYGMLSSSVNYSDPLKKFVKSEQINYILVDEEVRSWGFSPVERPYLKLVYSNTDVQIYEIDQKLLD